MTTKACDTPCEACNKQGLPIYPVRYAIAQTIAGAPKLSGDFEKPGIALGEGADYTARLPRSGYLYVYDEARRRWEGYVITELGYFVPFEVSKPETVRTPEKPLEPCSRDARAEVAAFITISSPKQASLVWLGYSDVMWTEQVLKDHEDVALRRKHMTEFNVATWLSSQTGKHAQPIAQLQACVAEHYVGVYQQQFAFSAAAFNWRRGLRTSALVKAADGLYEGKGAIVALHDPVGIAQDIAALAALRLQYFMDGEGGKDRDRARKLAVSGTITGLRGAIENQAELDEIEAAKAIAYGYYSGGGLPPILFDPDADKLTPEQLDRAKTQAWEKYLPQYDEAGRVRWQDDYDKALDAYTKARLDPLAEAHVGWMKSDAFKHYMVAVFDKGDPRSGAVYTAVTHVCVQGTAGLRACFDFYVESLKADNALDINNIVLRALIYNQKSLEGAAKNASEIDKRTVPWDSVYAPFKDVIEKMGKGQADQAGKLMYELAGPIAKALDAVIDGTAKRVVMGIVSLHAGNPWVRVQLDDSYEKFRELMVKKIVSMNGELSSGEVKRAVATEIQRLQMRGELSPRRAKQNWILFVEEKEIKGMPTGLSAEQRMEWVTKNIKTPTALYDMQVSQDLGKFKSLINGEVRMGIVSMILQIVCFTKLIEDQKNAMAADKTEAQWRLAAGGLAITGTVLEISGAVIEKMPGFQGALTAGRFWPKAALFLRWGGRALGAIGGVIMAGWDLYKSYQEFGKGSVVVGSLYIGSALLGLATTLGFLLGWNPFLLAILVACLVIVSIVLEWRKSNKIQNWLEQCIFGKGAHYASAELEMKEFELATK